VRRGGNGYHYPDMADSSSRLLLHACCAPCSVVVIDELRSKFDLTVFFYNPNIFPEAEYLKRKAEVIRVCREWGIPMVDHDNDVARWESEVGVLGPMREGGARCSACFLLRLTAAATYAKANGYGIFATSLTSGRRKNAEVINAVGKSVGEGQGVDFLDEDWKKSGRMERREKMVREMSIYQQTYCGCRFSLEEMKKRLAGKQSFPGWRVDSQT
jgi:predicted adenine nucleotide alpha hydrolase (AANH) superfamily ATPase